MVQPIQYQIPGVSPDPFAGVLQGLKIGGSLAEMDAMRAQRALQQQQLQQQIQQRQAAMEQQQRFQTGIQSALANPSRTWQDLEPLLAIAPNKDQADAVKTLMSNADARVLQNEKNFAANVLLAIESNPEVAKRLLTERMEAEQNPQTKQFYQTISSVIDVNPKQAGYLVELGGAQMYGKDWYEGVTNVRKTRQEEALAPEQRRKLIAEADKAVSDAKSAQAAATTAAARQQAELDLARANARKAEVEARVARTEEQLTGGVQATADIRTAVAATNLSPEQKRALVDIANVKAPKTVIDMGAGAEAEARGKSLVKEYEGLRDTAVASKKLLGNLEVAENILNKADFSTGFGTETKAAAASVLSALGVSQATQFATNAQTFLAQSREALLQKSILQKGTQTEGDAKRINETGAALGNTKDANKFILALAKTVAQRDIDKAKFYAQYDKENKTFRGADAAWEVSPEGSKSIFDYPAMRPFRNIQAPPAPAPAAPVAPTAQRPAAPGGVPPGFGPRAQSFAVTPQPSVTTESTEALIERMRRTYGQPR